MAGIANDDALAVGRYESSLFYEELAGCLFAGHHEHRQGRLRKASEFFGVLFECAKVLVAYAHAPASAFRNNCEIIC